MNQVIVFPRGQLTPSDKARMRKAGLIAVEADDPSKIVAVIPGAPLVNGNDLAMAAMKAVAESGYGSVKDIFLQDFYRRVLKLEPNP